MTIKKSRLEKARARWRFPIHTTTGWLGQANRDILCWNRNSSSFNCTEQHACKRCHLFIIGCIFMKKYLYIYIFIIIQYYFKIKVYLCIFRAPFVCVCHLCWLRHGSCDVMRFGALKHFSVDDWFLQVLVQHFTCLAPASPLQPLRPSKEKNWTDGSTRDSTRDRESI